MNIKIQSENLHELKEEFIKINKFAYEEKYNMSKNWYPVIILDAHAEVIANEQ